VAAELKYKVLKMKIETFFVIKNKQTPHHRIFIYN